MTVELNLANLIFILIAMLSAFWALVKIIAVQTQKHLDARFAVQEVSRNENQIQITRRLDNIETVNREDTNQWQRVERELMRLQVDMPLNYVRREDYVQAVASILVKLDAAQMRHENLLLKGLRHE